MYISGTIGYVLLQNCEKKCKKVLILSDIHSKIPYCDNNSFNISKWLNNRLKDNNHILLEEVPRNNKIELQELWSTSPHTQELKNWYLSNSAQIDAIDIRPYLFPFSWELIKTEINKNKMVFKEYLTKLINFFNKTSNLFNTFITPLIQTKILTNTGLSKHFIRIKKNFQNYLLNNDKMMNQTIEYLYDNNNHILIQLNQISSNILEWYTIVKIFSRQEPSIVHTGLSHSEEIVKNLITDYNFEVIDKDGVNYINQINEDLKACILLPDNINNKFKSKNSFGIFS